jgi:hypothetical protein
MTMPPDESLACFNDPERQTAGWEEALAEARRRIQEEHGPMLERVWKRPCPGAVKNLLLNVDLVRQATPWHLLKRPHYRVRVELPRALVQKYTAVHGAARDLFAYIFPRDIGWTDSALYYARLQDGSPSWHLPVLGQEATCASDSPPRAVPDAPGAGPFYFDVSLPRGRYYLNLSTKWHVVGPDLMLRFAVAVRHGKGQVIKELWKAQEWQRKAVWFITRAQRSLQRRWAALRRAA